MLDRFDKDQNGQLDVNEFVGFYSEVKAMYELLFTARRYTSAVYAVAGKILLGSPQTRHQIQVELQVEIGDFRPTAR